MPPPSKSRPSAWHEQALPATPPRRRRRELPGAGQWDGRKSGVPLTWQHDGVPLRDRLTARFRSPQLLLLDFQDWTGQTPDGAGNAKVDEYLKDEAFWNSKTTGSALRAGSREAAMLIIAAKEI